MIFSGYKSIKGSEAKSRVLRYFIASLLKEKALNRPKKTRLNFMLPGYFDKDTGEIIENPVDENSPPKYQDVFGNTIIELAKLNEKIVGITPAMSTGCSLNLMMKEMPERTFDVGIAEQHAVPFCRACRSGIHSFLQYILFVHAACIRPDHP